MIDSHVHIFAGSLIENRAEITDPQFRIMYGDPKARMASAEDLIAYMDENEIDRAVVCNMTWTDKKYTDINNDYILETCTRYADRLFPMLTLPYEFTEEDVEKISRSISKAVGIGEQRLPKKYLINEDTPLSLLTEKISEKQSILLLHTSEPVGHLYPGKEKMTPEILEPFLKRTDIDIVLAHFGGGIGFYALMKEVREYLSHCFFDTAATPYLYSSEIYDVMKKLVGPEKIMVGTDFPLMKIGRVMKQISETSLTESEIRLMIDENALKLFWQRG